MSGSLFDRNGVRKYLTARERLASVYAASNENAAISTFCLTLAFTGARISEVLALTAGRIDAADEAVIFETLKVVTPVVDYALTRKDVDPKRIALHGESLGGYLAPRAAAFEHRLAACITDDGVYDYGIAQLAGIPADKRAAVVAGLSAPSAPELDAMLANAMKTSGVARWAFTHAALLPRIFL